MRFFDEADLLSDEDIAAELAWVNANQETAEEVALNEDDGEADWDEYEQYLDTDVYSGMYDHDEY